MRGGHNGRGRGGIRKRAKRPSETQRPERLSNGPDELYAICAQRDDEDYEGNALPWTHKPIYMCKTLQHALTKMERIRKWDSSESKEARSVSRLHAELDFLVTKVDMSSGSSETLDCHAERVLTAAEIIPSVMGAHTTWIPSLTSMVMQTLNVPINCHECCRIEYRDTKFPVCFQCPWNICVACKIKPAVYGQLRQKPSSLLSEYKNNRSVRTGKAYLCSSHTWQEQQLKDYANANRKPKKTSKDDWGHEFLCIPRNFGGFGRLCATEDELFHPSHTTPKISLTLEDKSLYYWRQFDWLPKIVSKDM